jgi:phenylacetate-CoA ligase
MMGNEHMWDPAVEAMPRDELDALQLQRLQEQVRHVATAAPLYRRKLAEAGVTPEQIRTLDDVRRLPFTTKAELRESQEVAAPYGEQLAVAPEEIAWTYTTSGSTGTPLLVPRSRKDVERIGELCARLFHGAGMRRGDVVQMAYQFHFIMGGIGGTLGTMRTGAQLINSGPGQTDRQLWSLERLGTTMLLATASYAEYLARVGSERGMDLESLRLRTVLGGGEAGFALPSVKQRLKDAFPTVERALDMWGFTDMWSPLAGEYEEGAGLTLFEDVALFEVVDPDTDEPVAPGEDGELIVTDLVGEATPLLRFRTGDRVRIVDEPSADGRTARRMPGGILGRTDDMVTIRSRNLWPSAVAGVINEVAELNGQFLCVVDRPAEHDVLTVRAEMRTGVTPSAELEEQVRDLVRRVAGVRADVVELVEPGTLPHFPYKAIRKLDLRRGETIEQLVAIAERQASAAR